MNTTPTSSQRADVCFLLEGTYPYVAGGVSTWVHEIIKAQPDLTFSIVVILANAENMKQKYELPPNVIHVQHIFLHGVPAQPPRRKSRFQAALMERAKETLTRLIKGGELEDLEAFLDVLEELNYDRYTLMNSFPAWEMLTAMYEETVPQTSFLDYFWTWRMLIGSIIATLSCPLPEAGCYHTVSTGYAGLLASKAHHIKKRPVVLTEHGIYTNERRIEISMAEWLYEDPNRGLSIESGKRDLRDIWMDAFATFSHICYTASDKIITLYGGNQILQQRDGADPARMRIVPNGVDYDGFSAIPRMEGKHRPVVALIGRVVPIKDVKTFIRAINQLRQKVPNVQALIMGPYDEDKDYYDECAAMVALMGLDNTIEFLGRVNIREYLGKIDAIVLTSISEAQPLVILEAGAAGIPSVTTDVGACHEMIYGHPTEDPPLGAGGAVVPVANPAAVAAELAHLLNSPPHWQSCSDTIRERVRSKYHEDLVNAYYRELYLLAGQTGDGHSLPREDV